MSMATVLPTVSLALSPNAGSALPEPAVDEPLTNSVWLGGFGEVGFVLPDRKLLGGPRLELGHLHLETEAFAIGISVVVGPVFAREVPDWRSDWLFLADVGVLAGLYGEIHAGTFFLGAKFALVLVGNIVGGNAGTTAALRMGLATCWLLRRGTRRAGVRVGVEAGGVVQVQGGPYVGVSVGAVWFPRPRAPGD